MKPEVNESSVEKAFALLEFLAGSDRPVSLRKVAEAVKLPKPTAYRLLHVLQHRGYVSRPAGSRDYLIGARASRLAAVDPHGELKVNARPILRRLHEKFNETVNLGVLSGTQVLYLDFVETTQQLRFIVSPGQGDPWFCTALGRAAAAELEASDIDKMISATRFLSLTPQTVKTRSELIRRVDKARANGYAEEIEETVAGVCCFAVGLASIGYPGAAISVAVPKQRLGSKRRTEVIRALLVVGADSSEAEDRP